MAREEHFGHRAFKFVEHAAGAHWIGERFADYYEQGKPYLDGFKAFFIINSAARINAQQAGEVLTEFRGHAPADRDKLVSALGDKVEYWKVLGLQPGCRLQHGEEAFRRRASASCALARARPLEGRRGALEDRAGARSRRPAAARLRICRQRRRNCGIPGFGTDIAKPPARKPASFCRKRVRSNLKFKLTNRNVNMPYTPVGVWLINEWRQIGVKVEHEQLETRLYTTALQNGNYEVALDFHCDFMDEPNLQLIKYISADKSSINYGRYQDRTLDELYDKQSRTTDAERKKLVRRIREAGARTGLHHPDRVVAPHHRELEAAQGLGHHAEPLPEPGPGGRVAEPVAERPSRIVMAGRSGHDAAPEGVRTTVRNHSQRNDAMLRYAIKRILLMIPTLIGVAVLVFVLLRLMPGDIVDLRMEPKGAMSRRRRLRPSAQGSGSTSRLSGSSPTG